MRDELEFLKTAPQGDGPSDNLMRRLRTRALETTPRRRWRLSYSAACVAAVVLVGAAMLTPTSASARTFEGVIAAVERANAFQLSVHSLVPGKSEEVTFASVDGRIAIDMGGSATMRLAEDAVEVYDARRNTLTRLKLGGLVDAKTLRQKVEEGIAEGIGNLDLETMLRDYMARYGRESVRIIPGSDGTYSVRLESPKVDERITMSVNGGDNLPRTMVLEQRKNAGWVPVSRFEMRFGHEVSPNLALPAVPKNARVEEVDLGSPEKINPEAMAAIERAFEGFAKKSFEPQP